MAVLLGCTVYVPEAGFGGNAGPAAGSNDDDAEHEDDDDGDGSGAPAGDDGDDDAAAATDDEGAAHDGAADGTCGDGIALDPEACDGTDFAGTTCVDFGFDGGELTCTPGCVIITEGCYGCGDGVVQPGEVCDGSALNGASCESLGFGAGSLLCNDTCSAYETRACPPAPECGDGMRNGDEDCEGADLAGATCISEGYSGGALSCAADCTYDYGDCTAQCGGYGTPCGQPGGCCGSGCGVGGTCTINGVQVCCS